MTMMITEQEARALAKAIETMRPDWNFAGIVKALADSRTKAHKWTVAQAALTAASNPDNRTPAVIPLPGNHWPEIPAPTPPRRLTPDAQPSDEELAACHRQYLAARAVLLSRKTLRAELR